MKHLLKGFCGIVISMLAIMAVGIFVSGCGSGAIPFTIAEQGGGGGEGGSGGGGGGGEEEGPTETEFAFTMTGAEVVVTDRCGRGGIEIQFDALINEPSLYNSDGTRRIAIQDTSDNSEADIKRILLSDDRKKLRIFVPLGYNREYRFVLKAGVTLVSGDNELTLSDDKSATFTTRTNKGDLFAGGLKASLTMWNDPVLNDPELSLVYAVDSENFGTGGVFDLETDVWPLAFKYPVERGDLFLSDSLLNMCNGGGSLLFGTDRFDPGGGGRLISKKAVKYSSTLSDLRYAPMFTAPNELEYEIQGTLPVGDLNGDRQRDFAIIERQAVGDERATLRTHIFYARAGLPAETLTTSADVSIFQSTALGELAFVPDSADFNGDGIDDLIRYGWDTDYGITLYIHYGSTSGISESPDVTIFALPGYVFSSAPKGGDINGDGIDDLVVSVAADAPANVGRIAIIPGSRSLPSNMTVPSSVVSTLITCEGPLAVNGCGNNIYGIGAVDLNVDGYTDVVVSAPDALGGEGMVALLYGGPSLPKAMLFSEADVFFTGTSGYTGFGSTVWDDIGDIDGDGYPDFMINEFQNLGDAGIAESFLIHKGGSGFVSSVIGAEDAYIRVLKDPTLGGGPV
jgi:hypothetical protein